MAAEPFVLLCECNDALEADLIESTLEAKGIPVWVFGTHASGVGSAYGLRPQVKVRKRDLALAAAIVEPIVGAIPGLEGDGAVDSNPGDPMRPIPLDELPPTVEEDPPDLSRALAPKRVALPFAIAASVGLLFAGASHLYIRKRTHAAILLMVGLLGWGLLVRGQAAGAALLGAAWLFDLVGGVLGVRAYNAALSKLARLRGTSGGGQGGTGEQQPGTLMA